MKTGNIHFKPIGSFRKGIITVKAPWAKGLKGIEGFSHLIVLFWLDKAHKPDLFIHPRGIKGIPKIGFLTTRTPHRPNPIGFTVVRLMKHKGAKLWVKGLDAWDGTPILDLKPYTKRETLKKFKIPGWVKKLDRRETDPLRRYGS